MKPEAIEAEANEILGARSERVLLAGASVAAAPWFLFEQLGRGLASLIGPDARTEARVREHTSFESAEVLVLRRQGATIELTRSNGERVLSGPAATVVGELQKAFRLWQKTYPARVKHPLIKAFVGMRLTSLDVFSVLLDRKSNDAALAAAKSPLELYQRIVGETFPMTLTPAHTDRLYCGSEPEASERPESFTRAMITNVAALKGRAGFSLSAVGRHLLYVAATPQRLIAVGDVLLFDADDVGDPRALHHALVFVRDFAAQIDGSFGLMEGRLIPL